MIKMKIAAALCFGLLGLSACAGDQPEKVGSRDDIIVNNRSTVAMAENVPTIAPAVGEGEDAITEVEMSDKLPTAEPVFAEEARAEEAAEMAKEGVKTEMVETATEVEEVVQEAAPEMPSEPAKPMMEKAEMPEMEAPVEPVVETVEAPAIATPEVVEPMAVEEVVVETPAQPVKAEMKSTSNIVSEDQTVDKNPPVQAVVTEDQTIDTPTEKVYVSPYVDTTR